MKIWKRGLSVGLSLVMCAGLVAPGFAASFADLQGAINGAGDAVDNQFTAEDGTTRYGYGAKNGETGKYEIEAWNGTRNVLDNEGKETGETADTRHVRLNEEVKRQDDEDIKSTITIENGADVTLDLNGNNVDANTSDNSVITVKQGGELTLTDSAASTYIDEEGNETYQSGTVTGGTGGIGDIFNNKYGGGVYNNGTFTMSGGKISGNTAGPGGCGGGVRNHGTFIMNGGEISGNTALTSGGTGGSGGGVSSHRGTFIMNGGEISGNTALRSFGGGVYNNDNSTFILNNGKISGNTANQGGGVRNYGTFTMSGGKISGNTADEGGGVYSYGTFTMNNGVISGNAASGPSNKMGGGVCNEGIFTMDGGFITNNTAGRFGGGVHNWRGGTFTMGGGAVIAGNKAGQYADEISGSGTYIFLPEDSLWDSDSMEDRADPSSVRVYTGAEVNGMKQMFYLKHHVHSFTEEQITKQPTCTEKGEMVGSGCACGQPTVTVELDPLGHDMTGEWYETKKAQPGVAGEERRDCQREGCGHFETRPTEALPKEPDRGNGGGNGGSNPTDPTDPTNPTNPTDPTNPTNPTNPTVEVDEPDVPLGDQPEGDGDPVEIDEPETPLGELPEASGGSDGTAAIDDPAVPLGGVPQTGEASTALWLAVLATCGLGLVYVNTGKRKENA